MILNLDIDLSSLPKDKITEGKNGHKYIKLTASTMKQADRWGNDLTVYVTQSKEERESRADRLFVGKGKTFGENKAVAPIATRGYNDMPF